jgi:hypothetical protein
MFVGVYSISERENIFTGDAEEFLESIGYDNEVEEVLCSLEGSNRGTPARKRIGDLIIGKVRA